MKLTGHLTDSVYQRYAIVDSTMLEEGVAKLAAMSETSIPLSQSRVQVAAFPVKHARKPLEVLGKNGRDA